MTSRRADLAHAAGLHDEAVLLYAESLRSMQWSVERRELEERIGRCVAEIGNPAAAVSTALTVLDVASDVSFRHYNYLVARAVTNRTTAMDVVDDSNVIERLLGRSHTAPRPTDRSALELALTRLNVFLEAPSKSVEERGEGELLRDATRATLAGEPVTLLGTIVEPSTGPRLPEGSVAELKKLADDHARSRFDRGKAAFAAGVQLEKQGEKATALSAYREAFELIRSVLPFYNCATADGDVDPDMNCLELVVSSINRLDALSPVLLKGGLQFHAEGIPLPSLMEVSFAPVLVDASIATSGDNVLGSQGQQLYHKVRLRAGHKAWVGVADGRYRIKASSQEISREANENGSFSGRLLDVDYSVWPAEVEVRGGTVDLAIRIYGRQELQQLEPPDHTPVDLRSVTFRWTPVQGAAYYQISFTVSDAKKRNSVTFASFKVTSPSLTLRASLPDWNDNEARLREYLEPGVTAEWQVRAYDSKGLNIGTHLDDACHFLVAQPLDEESGNSR